MAETTLVRPYAKAVFELASQSNTADSWSDALETLTSVVAEPAVQQLIASPAVGSTEIAEIVIKCCGELDDRASNLVRLLSDNGKLILLPELRVEFEVLKAEAERIVDVEITSAVELTEAQLGKLVDGIKARLNRDVRVTTAVDAELIGGAVVRAADLVIDGSVRSKLAGLNSSLLN